MNAHSSMIHVRMDNDLKERATEALAAMGLSTADAVRLLFHRIATDQAFPLELKVPNAETRAAMEEVAQMKAKGRSEEHTSELQSLMRYSYAGLCLKKNTSELQPLKHNSKYSISFTQQLSYPQRHHKT